MKNPQVADKKLLSRCPFCAGQLSITKLSCDRCDTNIESTLAIPPFFRLPADLQDFVMVFLRCQGKIRDVERELSISYPTVCKRLDMVNQLLGNAPAPLGKQEILERLDRGEISVSEATQLLKEKV